MGRRGTCGPDCKKMWRFLFGSSVVVALLGSVGRLEAAGNAYAVDDADIGKAGSCQNEAWVSWGTNKDFVGVESPACVVQLGIPVEFSLLYQRTLTSGDWATA